MHTLKLLLGDLWVTTGLVEVVTGTDCEQTTCDWL